MENCNDYDGLGVKERVTCFCVGVNSMKRLPWARRFSVINIAWTNAFFALHLLLLHLSLPLSSNASSTSHRALKWKCSTVMGHFVIVQHLNVDLILNSLQQWKYGKTNTWPNSQVPTRFTRSYWVWDWEWVYTTIDDLGQMQDPEKGLLNWGELSNKSQATQS